MIRAIYVPTSNAPELRESTFSHAELWELFGDEPTRISVPNGCIGYIDRNAKAKGRPRNRFATMLMSGYLSHGDYIAGPLLVFSSDDGKNNDSVSKEMLLLYQECWEQFQQWTQEDDIGA